MRRLERWIRLLIIGNVVLVALLATVIALDLTEASRSGPTVAAAVAGPWGNARTDGHGRRPYPDQQRLHPVPRRRR